MISRCSISSRRRTPFIAAFTTSTTCSFASLLSVKTGGCPEDCAYWPQSAHHRGLVRDELMMPAECSAPRAARGAGAAASAWAPPGAGADGRVREVLEMVRGVRRWHGGVLHARHAHRRRHSASARPGSRPTTTTSTPRVVLRVDYHHADLRGSPRHAAACGSRAHVCCGGIIGMGESVEDRGGMLPTLANLDPHPESVPINALVPVEGTPLAERPPVDALDSCA